MAVVFGLEHAPEQGERRRYRTSYLRLLKDWGFDANSPAGAVLKGWVESRFGLFPTFHKEPLQRFNSPAWFAYVEEKMSSRFHNNNIYMQLDVLYEFCQWVAGALPCARQKAPDAVSRHQRSARTPTGATTWTGAPPSCA